MGTFSTGIGLVSGIDSDAYIDAYMSVESRPVQLLQSRIQSIDIQRTAYVDISARLLAVQNAIARFSEEAFFNAFSANSSNDSVLAATASETAAPGSYTFQAHSLVATHSVISRGFADADTTPVGVGTMSLEMGNGRINPATSLDTLNGGQGIDRGTIKITDRSGSSADIDLSIAMTVDDVLGAINGNADINVRASVTSLGTGGDRIVIEDLTPDGEVTGNLSITDDASGQTAADLGIAGTATGGRIDGTDLVYMTDSTLLSVLNDGNGVGRVGFGTDADLEFDGGAYGSFTVSFGDVLASDTNLATVNSGNGVRLGTIRITNRVGVSAEIDLSSAVTAQDVRDAINASGIDVTATMINSHFMISDNSNAPEETELKLTIEDVDGFAAADLGIAGTADDNTLFGRDIYRVRSIGDVARAINYASGNNDLVRASISQDGNSIVLQSLGIEPVAVTSLNDSTAAQDLGIEGATINGQFESRRLLAGLNTVLLQSLNGGSGVDAGAVAFTDRAGNFGSVDFSQAATLQDVIDVINSDANPTNIEASVNSAGNGIVLRDTSGGTGQTTIADAEGTLADDLGIAGTFTGSDVGSDVQIDGGNLQLQYVSRQTLLSELNNGRGISPGKLRITDARGAMTDVNVSSGMDTLGQLIDAINLASQDRDGDGTNDIEARINDTGDGLLIVDNTTDGIGLLTIEDLDGGLAASDLRLAGSAGSGESFIDGSYEIRIDISASDTLNDIVARIEESGGGFSASVLNNHGDANPYSLTITSGRSGLAGEMIIDTGGIDLGFSTLSRAQNAVVSIGGSSDGDALLISSSTNTLENVVEGLTIDLLSVADEQVTVTVAQDIDGMVDSIRGFVDKYNEVQSAISNYTSYNTETEERGALLGDSTVNTIRTRMQSAVSRKYTSVDDSMSRLAFIGIGASASNLIEFDEEKFREVYAQSPESVEKLFTTPETGFGAVIDDTLDELTRDFDGIIARKDTLLEDQKELLSDRIESLNVLMEAKRARLQAQFVGLEQAISSLQNQQSSLSSLTNLFSS